MTESDVLVIMLLFGALICAVLVVGGQIKDAEDRRILRDSAQTQDKEQK